MESTEKQEILDAIAALSAHMDERLGLTDERIDGLETRMSGMEGRIGGFAQEMRTGFESIDHRLVSLEDKVEGMEKSLDEILEGDVLGKNHITLTRPEYDTMVETSHLPNRFQNAQ